MRRANFSDSPAPKKEGLVIFNMTKNERGKFEYETAESFDTKQKFCSQKKNPK